MKRWIIALCVLGLFGLAPARAADPDAPNPANAEVQKAIDAGNAKYIDAHQRLDPEEFADLYDENGARFGDRGNGTVVRGHKDIASDVAKFMNAVTGPIAVTIATQRLYVLDDFAYEEGKYTLSFTLKKEKAARQLSGQYVTVWKRQADGGWKIYADMPVPQT